jgi:hypothetical protein
VPNESTFSGLVEPRGRGEEPLFYFTRAYVLFLQGLFKQLPSGSYHWSEDENLSEVVITGQIPVPRERVEQRPAIVVMRGPARFANLTLDNMRRVSSQTGEKERTDLIACTMSVNVICKNEPEANRLGFLVLRHTRTFKTMLQRLGFHKIGDDGELGPISPPGALVSGESDPEFLMVTVQIPFFFQWTEKDTPSSYRLREIEAHLRSALEPYSSTTEGNKEYRAALSPPTIRGRVINTVPTGHQRVGVISQTAKT